MEFIKDDRADACQIGVGLDHAGQDAFCYHLDAGGFADRCFAAHTVTDGFASGF